MFAAIHSNDYSAGARQPWPMCRLRSLNTLQPRHLVSSLAGPEGRQALRAIAQVIRNAHQGDLPLFAATLGLPADEFQELLHEDLRFLVPQVPSALLRDWLPERFMPLAALLWSYRVTDESLARWLSHAIAAACYGRQHLWQDLGFRSRDDVSRLIAQWFPRLFQLNTRDLKWKRFLFEQLGQRHGVPDLKPPHCEGCDSYPACFAMKRE